MNDVEHRVSEALVGITAALCDRADMALGLGFVLTRCLDLLAVDGAGMMVVPEAARGPVPVASSADPVRSLQESAYPAGPAGETFASGLRTDCPDLAAEARWPGFRRVARQSGFAAVHTLPMRLHGRMIGVLTLSATRPGTLTEYDLDAGQVLADVGALGVGSYQGRQSELRADQLQTALHSRVVIEQAKGLIAERLAIPVDEAFEILRTQARSRRRKLHEMAAAVLAGETAVVRPRAPGRPR